MTHAMQPPITPHDTARFEREGYLLCDPLIQPEKAAKLLRALQGVIAEHYSESSRMGRAVSYYKNRRNTFWIINTRLLSEEIRQLVTGVDITGIATALLRTASVSLLEDQFMNKPPAGNGISLHQDAAYFPLAAGSRVISCWIALDEVTADMGPLQLVPRSHQRGLGPLPDSLHEEITARDMRLAREVCAQPDPRLIEVCVGRGGGVFFEGCLVHGSSRNTSTRWRPGFSLHFASAESRYDSSKLVNAPDIDLYEGLIDGDPLVNRFIPSLD